MIDIQSPTVEIRRGKKEEERRQKKPQYKNIMSASAMQGGHKSAHATTTPFYGHQPVLTRLQL